MLAPCTRPSTSGPSTPAHLRRAHSPTRAPSLGQHLLGSISCAAVLAPVFALSYSPTPAHTHTRTHPLSLKNAPAEHCNLNEHESDGEDQDTQEARPHVAVRAHHAIHRVAPLAVVHARTGNHKGVRKQSNRASCMLPTERALVRGAGKERRGGRETTGDRWGGRGEWPTPYTQHPTPTP